MSEAEVERLLASGKYRRQLILTEVPDKQLDKVQRDFERKHGMLFPGQAEPFSFDDWLYHHKIIIGPDGTYYSYKRPRGFEWDEI